MASRNQSRPPFSLPRSSSRGNENGDEGPTDKRRKIAGKMATPLAPNLRPRSILGTVNAGPEMAPQPAAAVSKCAEGGGWDFKSREDVELLLNEKMTGKNKTDKAKCEQRMEYIKKLKCCIKWFEGLEDGLKEDKLKLQSMIESLEKQCVELAEQKKKEEEKLIAELDTMKKENDSLRRSLESEESDKLAAIDLHSKEVELRNNIEKSRDALTEDLRKAQLELMNSEQQVKNLQDINERFQIFNSSLERHNTKLENDAIVCAETTTKLQQQKTDLTEALNSSRAHCSSLQKQLSSSKASLQDALKEKDELKTDLEQLRGELRLIKEDRDSQLGIVQSLQSDLAKFKELTGKSSLELGNLSTRNDTLEATCSAQRSQIQLLQSQLEAANEKLQLSDSTAMETIAQFEKQKRMISELQSRLSLADLKILEAEKLRKKLHNTILELKGNIRVFCRVRPLNPDDDDNGSETSIISYPSSLESQGRGIDLTHNGQKYPFTFDKVFDQETTQEDVFVEISQLVQSALDGYKVCIFAYGQTGSGKTYTMMGKTEESNKKGLIPRSLEQIFQTSQALSSQGWKYKMQASMLEIYNETIRDLLSVTKAGGSDSNANTAKQYSIKHDQNGNTTVSDLTVVDVCSIKEVSYLLNKAAQSRSVGKTHMNEQSSRSHFVFTLRIFGVNESTDQQVQGVLNLIDLAGSERLAKSGSTGDRLKETQAINKSLSALSDVIFSIAKREDHIPFRNSKLTYLLQPCLGGDAKTLMFVNVSPAASSTGESICSLRFAARVNACEVGVPRRHTQQQLRAVDSRLSYG